VPEEEGAATLLGRLEMFSELSESELEELASVAVPRSYDAGEVVFREGDEGDTCHVVRSGTLKVTKAHPDGRTVALTELHPGDMFGELALFDGERRSATIETLEPTTTVAMLAEDIKRLLATRPPMAVKMLGALANRVRAANERIARQSFQGVAGRVASVLLAQVEARQAEPSENRGARATASEGPKPQPPAVRGDVVVAATQADIAELASAARESASRFLAELERDGVVTLRRGRVIVHEPDALRNYIY
jgi:CRP/FNR family cyclic AMP-dependent transcriptional regulator